MVDTTVYLTSGTDVDTFVSSVRRNREEYSFYDVDGTVIAPLVKKSFRKNGRPRDDAARPAEVKRSHMRTCTIVFLGARSLCSES